MPQPIPGRRKLCFRRSGFRSLAAGSRGRPLMAVTRSTIEARAAQRQQVVEVGRVSRAPELVWLIMAAFIVCGAWWLVYTAKVRRAASPTPPVNLSQLERA